MNVAPEASAASSSSGSGPKCAKPNTVWPRRGRRYSLSCSSLTLTTRSQSQGSPSVAPARRYSASGKPTPAPAPGSTTTFERPAMPEGVRATRNSPSFTSRGTPIRSGGLLQLHAGLFHDPAPLLDFRGDVRARLGRRRRPGFGALRRQELLLDVGLPEHAVQLGIQPADDLARGAARREQCVPVIHLEAGQAGL